MKLILTFDVGTTSVKTNIYDGEFKVLGSSIEEYQLSTSGNRVELPAHYYWDACRNGITQACELAAISPGKIDAIAVTTQGETLISVDKQGNILRNAIVWLDGRADKESEIIRQKYSNEEFYLITGQPECTGLTPLSKLLWIKFNEPEIYENTHKFLLLEDYIIYCLTGKFVTEKSLMSSTGYFDIRGDKLWGEILEELGLDIGKIPDIMESGEIVSEISANVARETGLNPRAVTVTAAMDQIAAAIGSGNITEGTITETNGTALVIAYTSRSLPATATPITVYRHAISGSYLYLAVCMTSGIILKWFKDEFCGEEVELSRKKGVSVYEILGNVADSVSALGSSLVLLPYFTGVIQPDNNPRAKGVFFGVGLETKKKHFIRSIFESVGYMLKENILLIETFYGKEIDQIRLLGGGAKSRVWSRIKADICRKDVCIMAETECTSLGTAMLAALAMGWIKNLDAEPFNRIIETLRPQTRDKAVYDKGFEIYTQIYSRLKELF